jgi:uncharacterized protein YjbI with pentapeptide repeats
MSELTREEILKLIEENGGPDLLDLSGKDLSDIDLSKEAIASELKKRDISDVNNYPVWARAKNNELRGIHLLNVNLQEANLVRANLQGALLYGAKLRKVGLQRANLQEAMIGNADLQEASLVQANLQEANLAMANLQRADLEYAMIRKAQLYGANFLKANLSGADLPEAELGSVTLREANLGGTNLRGAKLRGADLREAYLGGANLQGAALSGANLQDAKLLGAKLQGARLRYAHLEKVDFFGAKTLRGAYFYNAFLDDTRLKREQLGREIGEEVGGVYDLAREAYLALKNNFAEIGRYRDESWAYVKERQMGKMCSAPWRARKFYGKSQLEDSGESRLPAWHPRVLWFYLRHTLKWLSDWFVELLCGYGESIWRVLFWMLLVVLGFAAYYQVSHAVVTSSQEAATSLWDHLIFSLGAFTTLQPTRLQAARPGVELLTTIQAIIGISLAGLLGFVAGNRIRRS